MKRAHREHHRTHRAGWLRAAVLGANDGTISVASLVVGVAAADAARGHVLLSGVAGLVAGALSMAAGEYVSVQSQADLERADIARERDELETEPERELEELSSIYASRGVEKSLARRVAAQMMNKNALEAHARDELGITDLSRARPLQAALASAASFSVGGLAPVAAALAAPTEHVALSCAAAALVALTGLGATAAYAGGASMTRGSLRVALWGVIAMGVTAAVGALFGAVV